MEIKQKKYQSSSNSITRKQKKQQKNLLFILIGITITIIIVIKISQKISSYKYHKKVELENKKRLEKVRQTFVKDSLYRLSPQFILDSTNEELRKLENEKFQMQLAKERILEEQKFSKTKSGKYYKFCKSKNANVSKDDCIRAADNKIWIGMNYWLLVAQRGKPNTINKSNYGDGIRYQYCWNDYTPSCFYDNNNDDLIDMYN